MYRIIYKYLWHECMKGLCKKPASLAIFFLCGLHQTWVRPSFFPILPLLPTGPPVSEQPRGPFTWRLLLWWVSFPLKGPHHPLRQEVYSYPGVQVHPHQFQLPPGFLLIIWYCLKLNLETVLDEASSSLSMKQVMRSLPTWSSTGRERLIRREDRVCVDMDTGSSGMEGA